MAVPCTVTNRSGVTILIKSHNHRSRNRSPTTASVGRRTSLVLSIPLQTNVPLATAVPQASLLPCTEYASLSIWTSLTTTLTNVSTPTLTSAYYSAAESSGSSPTIIYFLPTPFAIATSFAGGTLPSVPTSFIVLFPSDRSKLERKQTPMSYSDRLASTAASPQLLSSLTTSAFTSKAPPHIPRVSGITQA
jgi:hypothetical protein